MIELQFEMPRMIALNREQAERLNNFRPQDTNIDFLYPSVEVEPYNEIESDQGVFFLDENMIDTVSIDTEGMLLRPIRGHSSETGSWHFDGSAPYDSSSKYQRVIALVSNKYPTEFASCTMTLSADRCVDFMRQQDGSVNWSVEDFVATESNYDDFFYFLSSAFDSYFGYDWLERAADGDSDISENVTVDNLSIVQALPNVVAYGAIDKILHRMPSSPLCEDRILYRGFGDGRKTTYTQLE